MTNTDLHTKLRQLEIEINQEHDTVKRVQLILERLDAIEQLCELVENGEASTP